MKSKKILFASISVILVVGCTSVEERQLASGNFDYISIQSSKHISVPAELDTPQYSNEYNIPELGPNAPKELVGKALKITSPALVLPMVRGSHIQEGNKSAMVSFDQVDDSQPLTTSIWNSLLNFLDQNDIGVDSFEREEGVLVTDWMLIKKEIDSGWFSWNTTESQTGRRFEFKLDVAPHGRSANLHVLLRDYMKTLDDELVAGIDDVQNRTEEVDILNQVIGHYNYEIGLKNSKFRQKIRQGLKVEQGLNADGKPAFVINGEYDITWPRLQLVLRKLGFNVKDLDKSNGLIFVNYGGADSGWFSIFSSDDLLDTDDYRLQVSKQGEKTLVTFMDDESVPFEEEQVASLHSVFAEAMANDDLDI